MPSPFHHRPPPAIEPLALGSGDIEALDYAPRVSGFPPPPMGYPSRPRPPQQPVAPRAPSPSPSLAPVAMNAARGRADSTGPQDARLDTVVVRSRPTMKMGFSILMAGIIFGGVLGITTKTRPASASQPAVETVLPAKEAAKDDDATNPAVRPEPAKEKDKDVVDASGEPKEPVATTTKGGKKKRAGASTGKVVVTSAAPKTTKEKPEKPGKDDDDGYRVASANTDGEREPAARSGKPKKPAPKAQEEEDEGPPPAAKPRTKPKASDDAVNVLKAAMGATENTL